MKFIECGCCGYFHKEDYQGDCRNDDERFSFDEIESENNEIIYLEDQWDISSN